MINTVKSIIKRNERLRRVCVYSYGFVEEVFTYAKSILKPRESIATKFIIFTQGRTGSTLLVDLLNCNTDIHCDDEIFHVRFKGRKMSPVLFAKAKAKISKKKVYGFKVKISQLRDTVLPNQNIDPEEFIINMYKCGWKIIYLKRNNIFRQTLSTFVAKAKGSFFQFKEDGPLFLDKIKIDADKFIFSIQLKEQRMSAEAEILKKVPHLKIEYENELLNQEHHDKTLSKVFEYLDVTPCPIKTEYVRTSKDNWRDYIDNYAEIEEKLSRTKYAKIMYE